MCVGLRERTILPNVERANKLTIALHHSSASKEHVNIHYLDGIILLIIGHIFWCFKLICEHCKFLSKMICERTRTHVHIFVVVNFDWMVDVSCVT